MSMPMILGFLILLIALLGAAVLLAKRRRRLAAAATGLAVLLLGAALAFGWLSFGYRPALLPILAVVTPDRRYTLGGANIPLPPRTVQTGGCTSTGRWFYSRSPLQAVAGFYQTAGAQVEAAAEADRVRITYEGVTLEAAAISAGESQLGIGCQLH